VAGAASTRRGNRNLCKLLVPKHKTQCFWLVEQLRLTPRESERLRQVSFERQQKAGLSHPGSAGLTADRLGDALPWLPVKEERALSDTKEWSLLLQGRQAWGKSNFIAKASTICTSERGMAHSFLEVRNASWSLPWTSQEAVKQIVSSLNWKTSIFRATTIREMKPRLLLQLLRVKPISINILKLEHCQTWFLKKCEAVNVIFEVLSQAVFSHASPPAAVSHSPKRTTWTLGTKANIT
jgi:hypothetical protein